jgi:hypothetical protein
MARDMADDEPRARFSPRLITLAVGGAALLLWLAMLWYMFGDVL